MRDLKRRVDRLEARSKAGPAMVIGTIPDEWYRRQPPTIQDMATAMRAEMTVQEWQALYCTGQSEEAQTRASRLWYAERLPEIVSPPPDVVQ